MIKHDDQAVDAIARSAQRGFTRQMLCAMKAKDIRHKELPCLSRTGRGQIDRIRQCASYANIYTMSKIANALGMELKIELIERSPQ